MIRPALLQTLPIVLTLCAAAPLARAQEPAAPRPDVLLVTLEATRADRLGCYGAADSPSPRLDALAARGVLFERAYAHAPWSAPAVASVMTGATPLGHGLHEDGRGALDGALPTLAEVLGDAGYRTGAFLGALELSERFGFARGFEHFDQEMGKAEDLKALVRDRRARFAVGACLEWIAQDDERPFLCWIDLADPRHPYRPPVDLMESDDPYAAELTAADRELGRLLDSLEARGSLANTLVLVVGVTGEALGEHGETTHGLTLQEACVRVPLIVVPAGGGPAGLRIGNPVGQSDVAPTVLELVGLTLTTPDPDPWAPFRGRSLAGVLGADAGFVGPRDVYLESEAGARLFGWSPLRGLVRGDWKLVRGARPNLYEVDGDPGEATDRAADEAERAVELGAALDDLVAAAAKLGARAAPVDDRIVTRLAGFAYALPQSTRGALSEGADPDPRDRLETWELYREALRIAWGGAPHLALGTLELAVASSPDSAALHTLLGVLYERSRRFTDAVVAQLQALELDPDSAMAHYYLARSQLSLGEPGEAELHYALAAEADPDLYLAHHALGRRMFEQQRLAEALPHYQRITELRPTERVNWLGLLHLARELDDWKALVGALEVAVQYFPEDLYFRNFLAWSLAAAPDDAVRDAERAVELAEVLVRESNEEDPGLVDTYAVALAAVGRFEDARRFGAQAVLRANEMGLEELVAAMRERLALYQQDRPYRETGKSGASDNTR